MFRTDQPTAASTLPTPAAAGTPGYFTNGNPATATPGTVVDCDFLNMIQEELCNVVTSTGGTLSKTDHTQVYTALVSIASAAALPSGAPFMFAGSSAPAGSLPANGAAVSRTTYANLFAAIGTTYGAGDGSTTFNIPDDRAIFYRGLDSGKGIDTGRTLGTTQTDSFQGFQITAATASAISVQGGSNPTGSANASNIIPTSDGTHGTPRISSETRPYNRAYLACIKY